MPWQKWSYTMRHLTLPEMVLWAILLFPTAVLFFKVIKARLAAQAEANAYLAFTPSKPGHTINDALTAIYKAPTTPSCPVCNGRRTIALKSSEIPCRFC